MSIEFDVETVSAASFAGLDSFEKNEESQATHFNKIYVPPFYPVQFCKKTVLNHQTQESQKSNAAVTNRLNGNNKAITEGNKAGASGSTDNEGNSRVDVHASHIERTDNGGSFEVGGHASGTRDSEGNTGWEVGGHVEIEF